MFHWIGNHQFHITFCIFQICILITLDGLHPYIVGYEDGRRLSARLFYKTITEL